MYLYGAGGHAKVIVDILKANNEPIEAFFDDNVLLGQFLGYPVLHSLKVQNPLIITIGNNQIRNKIAESLSVEYGTAIHPSSIISDSVMMNFGSVVMQGVIIQSSVNIGKHCIINAGALVSHDCIIDDYVHISPHATLCGNVTVGEGTWIGAGTTIIPGIKIGKWSVVGAGSVVTRDIPDRVLAVGNRCKVIKGL
jgi:sugar O-acyltransferase (sialic acid O-acetyltransferase NeuD family)